MRTFQVDDRVVVRRAGELTGITGTILGYSQYQFHGVESYTYIVGIDEKFLPRLSKKRPDKAIVFAEGCLQLM